MLNTCSVRHKVAFIMFSSFIDNQNDNYEALCDLLVYNALFIVSVYIFMILDYLPSSK